MIGQFHLLEKEDNKMRIIIDTNILFSFFWKDSLTKKLLITSNFELISSEIALDELNKYSNQIISRLNLTRKEFNNQLEKLKDIVKFEKKQDYFNFISEARKLSPDVNDADFFALCLKYLCILWSNDSMLKNQDKIKVLSTEEIIELFFE